MNSGRQQRSFRNLKLTERYRFQYLGHWVLICFLFLALLDVAVFLLYEQMWQSTVPQGADLASEQAWRFAQVGSALSLISVLFAVAIILLAVYTAHRIGGPLLAMKRTMAAVRDGNLDQRLHFRGYDKLDDVELAFNEMMDAVQERIEPSLPEVPAAKEVLAEPVAVA